MSLNGSTVMFAVAKLCCSWILNE